MSTRTVIIKETDTPKKAAWLAEAKERWDKTGLAKGAKLSLHCHKTYEDGTCAMELVAHVAGLEHTDAPPCVDPLLREIVWAWNDSFDGSDARTRAIMPLLPMVLHADNVPINREKRIALLVQWGMEIARPTLSASALRILDEKLDGRVSTYYLLKRGLSPREEHLVGRLTDISMGDFWGKQLLQLATACYEGDPKVRLKRNDPMATLVMRVCFQLAGMGDER